MKRPSPSIMFVFFTLLLDVLGFSLIIPVGPKLVATIKDLPTEGAEDRTAVTVGLLFATFAVMQFIFAPILGSLSDRFGRRPVILIALFGSGLDYFVGAFAMTLPLLFITRAINGISGANITACNAYIADVTPPEKRAAGFGIMGAAFGLGFVIGPLLGGLLGDPKVHLPLLGHGDIRYPYMAAGTLTLINWLYGLIVLPESLPADRRRPFSLKKSNPFGSFAWLWRHRLVTILAGALFLVYVSQTVLQSTWVLSMSYRFGWSPESVGWSLFVVGITTAIVQGLLARKIIPALGERACLVGGFVIAILAYIGYGSATQGWMILTIIAAASIGGVSQPAVQAIISKAIPPTEQGLLQGSLVGLQSIAGIIGPLVGTNLFHLFTGPAALAHVPGAPFFLSALLTALALVPIAAAWAHMPAKVALAPTEG